MKENDLIEKKASYCSKNLQKKWKEIRQILNHTPFTLLKFFQTFLRKTFPRSERILKKIIK